MRHEAGPNPQRGWGPLGAETSARLREKNGEPSKKLTDEKVIRHHVSKVMYARNCLPSYQEHFDSGPPGDLEYPSIWPPEEEFPGFRAFMDAYFDACHAAAMLIMEALEIGLKLPHGALTGKCTPPVSELRLNRYPSVNTAKFKEGLTKRNWSHSDFGVITLLFQDDVGGLELENRDHPGSFVPATKESPRELLVLISDTFQRWSNGVIRSGLHQVGPPPHLKGNKDCILPERYSAVFFFKANRNKSVGPLPQFVGPEQPAQYEDITALQLHQQLTSVLYN